MKFHTTKTFFLALNMIQKEMKKINSYAITLLMENGKLFSIIMESLATS
ncbi:hypothetical protein HMPREF1977_1490 [Capnocytophaga ochracea F0287]|uniref:Uncharacterized protein n=1 Tax=Capnocytophaga ochracea F0287 TaxID=873517 RepID=E4MSY0_CAPOC|nr:hypothetical protein HMPREF1977_1490 [Capnocytophaga ochracea F0287]